MVMANKAKAASSESQVTFASVHIFRFPTCGAQPLAGRGSLTDALPVGGIPGGFCAVLFLTWGT